MSERPKRFNEAEATIDWLIETVGHKLVVGAPLGLGKPATLLNTLYARAKSDPSLDLTFVTALSLEVPEASSDLERRIMDPIVERVFEDYPGLAYVRDLKADALPDNVTVSEFFFQPGAMLGQTHAQRHYRSVNYTHVARDLIDAGVNVLMQMGAPGRSDDEFSLSSNTDVTLDLMPVVERMRAENKPIWVVGQLNRRMPMMTRSALVDAALADAVFEGEAADFKPFGAPAMAVSTADYAIALRVSTLLVDGGTLQIGIGSLSDAIAYTCDLRHNHNTVYRDVVGRMNTARGEDELVEAIGGRSPFEQGLYGCTEMLVEAYIQLYRSGVLKRVVYDDIGLQQLLDAGAIGHDVNPQMLSALVEAGVLRAALTEADLEWLQRFGIFHDRVVWRDGGIDAGDDGESIAPDLSDEQARAAIESRCLGKRLTGATLVHGGFFLGPSSFYEALHALDDDERELFHMTSVGEINDLYGNESLKRVQRQHSRFVNTAIKATLSGAVTSDGLENGQVLSGVGGQYNFVAQAHELADARSILCVRATRQGSDGPESNILAQYAHTTIPRHLRDIVITEYGVADLRGKTDEEVAIAMIEIADARFQEELRSAAVDAGKLRGDYSVPAAARANTPDNVSSWLAPDKDRGWFGAYPYGSDFTEVEQHLIESLEKLQARSPRKALSGFARHASRLASLPAGVAPYLERLELDRPRSLRESLYARVVALALIENGVITSPESAGT